MDELLDKTTPSKLMPPNRMPKVAPKSKGKSKNDKSLTVLREREINIWIQSLSYFMDKSYTWARIDISKNWNALHPRTQQ